MQLRSAFARMLSASLSFLALTPAVLAGDGGSTLFHEVCSKCHGEKGQGNPELKTPSLAGQPDYYILSQLNKFRADMRGVDPKDQSGALMHAVALSLEETDMKKVAAQIRDLPPVPTQNTLGGDPAKGKILFEEHCMECHRYNGKGERVFKSPSLISLQDYYIVAQLKKFRTGTRGSHPQDDQGAKMHRATAFLDSEEDFPHLAAYIAVLAEKYTGKNNRPSSTTRPDQ